jgi:PadR family transcriptional regulator PadR
MATDRLDLLQGTLDLLVLKTLTWGPMHGYGVSSMISQRSDGDITVVDAALYKALHRLERDDLIASTWGVSENNRRAKFYALTSQGRARLRAELSDWRRYSAAVERIVGAT